MAYISRSHDHLPKKEILMACICDPKTILESNFLFWKFLMAYISRSHDIFPKKEILMASICVLKTILGLNFLF